jgi:hypothetical protein
MPIIIVGARQSQRLAMDACLLLAGAILFSYTYSSDPARSVVVGRPRPREEAAASKNEAPRIGESSDPSRDVSLYSPLSSPTFALASLRLLHQQADQQLCNLWLGCPRGRFIRARRAPVNEPTHARARETGARRRHTYAIGQRRRGRLAPPRTCRAGLISRRAAVLLPKLLLGLIPRRVGVSTSRTRR